MAFTRNFFALPLLASLVVAAPYGPISQIVDGQPQAPTAVISQISDGQPQAPTPSAVISQISDGQPQAPTPTAVISQISDGQPQAPTPTAVISQISDGQPQAPSPVSPISQISDGQPQAPVPTAVVSQISDGQPQAPSPTAVISQISDGQPQAPTPSAVISQISDGQPQAPTGAVPSPSAYSPASPTAVITAFGPDSQVPYSSVYAPPPPPIISSQVTGVTSHGPYSGQPTTTGAPQSGPLAPSIAPLGPNPYATYYNTNGGLTAPEPAPYTPKGGLGTNGSEPRYMVESDFDYESIALGLYQEWIELDLFHNGLATFSVEDFEAAGLNAEDRSLIEFMADQESGHATLLTNMLGETAPVQCTYDYPFTTVREFVDFNARLTRWGESGVWGFINHLDSREAAQLLAQSIATEARQEMIFRQMSGLHPMPVWFEAGIPQSWSWTYLAPYISSCPENNTRLAWQNFPTLHIVNNANINRFSPNDTADYEVTGRRIGDPSNSTIPADENCLSTNATGYGCYPNIAHNRSEPLSFAGKKVFFEWEDAGVAVGPNNSYVTSTSAGTPAFVLWVNQLNGTYTDLTVTGPNSGFTFQPNATVYAGDPLVNQTMFVALTDTNAFYSPFNLSMVNPHVRALGLYVAG